MKADNRSQRIRLLDFHSAPMRAFHMTWMAFFLCFFSWFGIAPLMPIVRDEFGLTKQQVGMSIIASVAITIIARLFVGWVCDRIGPRRTYAYLLILGSLPVMSIGLAQNFASFLVFRLLIGVIGASFVVTQYHTSRMFAPNCVGAANATTAGWGNLGGGVTQFVMPLIFAGFVSILGLEPYWGWRLSMVVAGMICIVAGIAYYFLTQDTPDGNFEDLPKAAMQKKRASGAFIDACRDPATWVLALLYGACFGVELTLKNVAALYFADYFGLGLQAAGFAAAAYGLMNLFARTLGGYVSDRWATSKNVYSRSRWLFLTLLGEGVSLIIFSQAGTVTLAVAMLMIVGLFVQMSNGATFSIVPFVSQRSLGSVAGVVGAGGNLGAVLAGFLFQGSITWPTALLIIGGAVTLLAPCALLVRVAESRGNVSLASPISVTAQPPEATVLETA